ncbi:MAG: hypothetical protein U5K75_06620 [Ahrensia sp.]|nr:hypothetical protein [Ahrensia sp.]
MQLPKRLDINERVCPIPEQVFGELRKSNPADAALIASSLPEAQRAQLVEFCYKRTHLHHLALIIASSCSRQALVTALGRSGELVFEQSRDAHKTIADMRRANGEAARSAISLASFGNKSRGDETSETNGSIVSLYRT